MDYIKNVKLRLILCSLCFLIIYIGVSGSLIKYFQLPKRSVADKHNLNKEITKKRGNILDKNGFIMATSIRSKDLIINPKLLKNPNKFYLDLVEIFNNKISIDIKKKLNSDLKYLKIINNIDDRQYEKVLMIGEPGIKIEEKYKRVYPGKTLASHILGKVDVDGKGISGLELKMDKLLSQGTNITLSIDSGVQNVLKNLMLTQIKKFKANGGAGIIMNANNGRIEAIVSLPDYNNNSNTISKEKYFNKATKGVYELGSTLKIFTAAMAIESGILNDNDLIDVSSPIILAKSQIINDTKKINFPINIPEVIVYSSNIGSAKIADKLGYNLQNKYFNLLGFNKRIQLEIVETSKPKINNSMHISSIMTKSYGYGIQITPLHLTKATAIVLNGGNYITPTLLKKYNDNSKNLKIFTDTTSKKIRSMLYYVVNNKNGTGKKAKNYDYPVGGKTGTAYKLINGQYSNSNKIVAFTGGFPINKPKYVFTIIIDDPKPQKFSFNMATGGWVVAPIITKLVDRIAPILGVKPYNFDLKKLNLEKYKIRDRKATL